MRNASVLHRFFVLLLAVALAWPLPELNAQTTGGSSINQLDARKRRTGWWLIAEPERMGEPARTVFGRYEAGRRAGQWYTLNSDGDIVAIENYKKDVLDGEVKYFEKGRLVTTGVYRGLNPDNKMDTVQIIDPISGDASVVVVPSERGSLRHGLWRFYDENNGQLRQEVEYQVDEVIFRKDYAPQYSSDSTYVQRRIKELPHNKGRKYMPPPGKRSISR